jgi:hypothetical protein
MTDEVKRGGRFFRPPKNNAKQFNYQLTSSHPRAIYAVEELYSRLTLPTNKKARHKQKQEALMRIVANLVQASHRRRGVFYSRDRNYYPYYRPQRYNGPWCSYRILVPLIDALEEAGMLTQTESQRWYSFEWGRKVWTGLSTVMVPTERFAEFADRFGLGVGMLEEAPLLECVVLRDENNVEIDYEDTYFTHTARQVILAYNELMETQAVNLCVLQGVEWDERSLNVLETLFSSNGASGIAGSREALLTETLLFKFHQFGLPPSSPLQPLFSLSPKEIEPGSPPLPTGSIEKSRPFFGTRRLTLTNLAVRRIFNETFDYGGRFFVGGQRNYQRFTKELRHRIRINGEPTVEPDFKCHHIRILYHLLGIDFRGDAYFFCDGDKRFREVMKQAVLRIINTRSRSGASNSVNKLLTELRSEPEGAYIPDEWTGPYLVGSFIKNHPRLVEMLWRGERLVGLTLQNKDSQIMEGIIARHVLEGVPLLCLHDSVRVPERNKELTKEIMFEEYRAVMGFEPEIG